MGRYFIEDIKSGITEGGLVCGPLDGNSVVSVKVKDEGQVFYLTYIRVFGLNCFYLTDRDYFDRFLAEDDEDEEFLGIMHKAEIDEFDGVALLSEDEDLYEEFKRCEGNEAVSLIRYLLLLACGIEDEYNEYTEIGLNKYISDIDVPLTDGEEAYNEDID